MNGPIYRRGSDLERATPGRRWQHPAHVRGERPPISIRPPIGRGWTSIHIRDYPLSTAPAATHAREVTRLSATGPDPWIPSLDGDRAGAAGVFVVRLRAPRACSGLDETSEACRAGTLLPTVLTYTVLPHACRQECATSASVRRGRTAPQALHARVHFVASWSYRDTLTAVMWPWASTTVALACSYVCVGLATSGSASAVDPSEGLQELLNSLVDALEDEGPRDQGLSPVSDGSGSMQSVYVDVVRESIAAREVQQHAVGRGKARRLLEVLEEPFADGQVARLRGNSEGMVLYSEGRTATGKACLSRDQWQRIALHCREPIELTGTSVTVQVALSSHYSTRWSNIEGVKLKEETRAA
eukprot:scaffold225_cov388-Prasinococcus_capsulatus_cf.AAC.13